MGMISKSPKKKVSKKSKRGSLVDALFSSTQQKVLSLLFGNPNRKYFATEVISIAKAGSGAVQRELASLSESGLVSVETIGKQKYYQANQASPIYEELRQITLKTMGLAEPLQNALLKTKAKIVLAMIYGSVAKGTDKATSDIDLLVVSDELSMPDLYRALESTERQLGRKISPILYSTAEIKSRLQSKNAFLEKTLSGARMTLIGDERVITEAG